MTGLAAPVLGWAVLGWAVLASAVLAAPAPAEADRMAPAEVAVGLGEAGHPGPADAAEVHRRGTAAAPVAGRIPAAAAVLAAALVAAAGAGRTPAAARVAGRIPVAEAALAAVLVAAAVVGRIRAAEMALAAGLAVAASCRIPAAAVLAAIPDAAAGAGRSPAAAVLAAVLSAEALAASAAHAVRATPAVAGPAAAFAARTRAGAGCAAACPGPGWAGWAGWAGVAGWPTGAVAAGGRRAVGLGAGVPEVGRCVAGSAVARREAGALGADLAAAGSSAYAGLVRRPAVTTPRAWTTSRPLVLRRVGEGVVAGATTAGRRATSRWLRRGRWAGPVAGRAGSGRECVRQPMCSPL